MAAVDNLTDFRLRAFSLADLRGAFLDEVMRPSSKVDWVTDMPNGTTGRQRGSWSQAP